jgi:hypothetical protein
MINLFNTPRKRAYRAHLAYTAQVHHAAYCSICLPYFTRGGNHARIAAISRCFTPQCRAAAFF